MRSRSLAAAGGLLIALGCSRPVGADGLGDAAHREAQKRQHRPQGPTFTDDDLQRRAPDASGAKPAAPAPQPSAATSSPEAPAADPLERERQERQKLEATWRHRFADARLRVAVAEAGSWRESVRTGFYKGVPVQMKVREQVETAELRQARQALAGLEEEFRRTGLPAGWARE